MKRIEPNALLAISTVIALMLVVATASVFSTGGSALKYIALGLASPIGFVLFNAVLMRRSGRRPKVMISAETPSTAIWSAIFPMMVMMSAILPLIAPNGDYGLMIIIAGVFTGVTIQSALTERRAGLTPPEN